jgi:4a-hydroxytetrahydrobiopterin dehydratase
MATLNAADVQLGVRELTGWTLEGNAIRKQFVFGGFPEAVDFVARLVPHAEAADHHPDVLINYKRVTLTYTTHSEGGLTQKDFDGARMADGVAAAFTKDTKDTKGTKGTKGTKDTKDTK